MGIIFVNVSFLSNGLSHAGVKPYKSLHEGFTNQTIIYRKDGVTLVGTEWESSKKTGTMDFPKSIIFIYQT